MMKHRVKPTRPMLRARHRLLHPGHHVGEAASAHKPPATPAAASPEIEQIRQDPAEAAEPHAAYEWLAAFDELKEPVFIHDKDFRILRCNPAYAAFAGQPMEAIIGKPYWQVFPKLNGPLSNCVEA